METEAFMKNKKHSSDSPRHIAINTFFMLKIAWKIAPEVLLSNFISNIIGSVLSFLLNVWLLRQIVNGFQTGVSMFRLLVLIVALNGANLIYDLLCEAYYQIRSPVLNIKINEHLQKMIIKKSSEVELSCYEDKVFFDKFIKAASDLNNRFWKVTFSVTGFVSFILSLSLNSLFVLTIDPLLFLFAIFPAIATLLLRKKRNSVQHEYDMKKQEEDRQRKYSKRAFYLNDFAKEMRLTNIYRVLFKRFNGSVKNIIAYIQKYGFKLAVIDYIIEISCSVVSEMGAMLYAVYRTFISGTMLYGDCLVVVNSISNLTYIFSYFTNRLTEFHENSLYVDTIKEYLDYEPKIKGGEILAPDRGTLELKHVSFRYAGQRDEVLHDVNLKIRHGEKIALVGHNGAGKSTLVKLLLRLYDPTEGEILYDGENIKNYKLTGDGGYRERFGTVFQDFKLFSLSVAENVTLRKLRDGDRTLVASALQDSGVYDKIENFDRGIDTVLTREFDDKGVILSGGEGQKVAIARAFAKDSEIVILDEPSSALDPIAEYKMYESMMRITKNRSVVFISHRLSSAVLADRIYLLNGGRVIEEGSHKELMEMNGKYAEMFRLQAKNYLDKEEVRA